MQTIELWAWAKPGKGPQQYGVGEGLWSAWGVVRDTFGQSTAAQLVLWILVLALMAGIAFYAMRRLREQIDEDQADASEMLSNFREMHVQGGLSDAEFRTIKTVLGAKLGRETKENGDKS